MKLLSTGNPKILKGEKRGYLSFVLHLAPADLSGYNVCPKATSGCKAACLNTAGRGGIFKKGEETNAIQQARIRRTRMFYENRPQFITDLISDIEAGIRQAKKKGLTPAFRLNGTSDISWEKYGIMDRFPAVQFYDYTKVIGRKTAHLDNYHLTFSQADGNQNDVLKAMAAGMNVAVVFRDGLPKEHMGRRVVDGDETDLRFLDRQGVIVGLYAKGKAKKDTSGFVVNSN